MLMVVDKQCRSYPDDALDVINEEIRTVECGGGWAFRSGTGHIDRKEGPTPFIDVDELPLTLSLDWDCSVRHPLGRKRIAYHAPIDSPYYADGTIAEHPGLSERPASFFQDCTAEGALCRGTL